MTGFNLKAGLLRFGRQISTPSTPSSGEGLLYMKSDDRLYYLDDNGAEMRVDNTTVRDLSFGGTLTVTTGIFAMPVLFPCVIESVAVTVTTVPTGAAILVDVNKNGTTIYGTQGNRPSIAISGTAATVGAHSVTTATTGDIMTIDVDQIGSTIAGANLVASIAFRRTG